MASISRRKFLAQAGLAATSAALLPLPRRAAAFAAEAPKQAEPSLAARLMNDPLRPQYHLLPAANWMNDPNGPVFYRGQYHMFFQYNPDGPYWGDMHWAHATSPDMIRWQHQPVAMSPTPDGWDRDGVFSGSIVLDGGTPTAIYTGVLPADSAAGITLDDGHHKWREVQCLATSTDVDLHTWKKLPEPIVATPPEGLKVTGFRDPGVWREGEDWLMTLGSGTKEKGGMVLIYKSRDLRHWDYLHPLIEGGISGQQAANPVDTGRMWECPDFFPLGDRHVLLFSAKRKVWWKTGLYQDRRFTPHKEGVLDFGSYYAAKTMLDAQGTRILWGWIPETRPEAEYRAAGWAGIMALPRVLSLGADGGLEMTVAPAAQTLRAKSVRLAPQLSAAEKQKSLSAYRIQNLAAELEAEFAAGQGFSLRFISEKSIPFTEISYDPARAGRELLVNEIAAQLDPSDSIKLQAWLDGSSLELIVNRKTTLTARIYTAPDGAPACPLKIEVANWAALRSFEMWQLNPISPDRLTS